MDNEIKRWVIKVGAAILLPIVLGVFTQIYRFDPLFHKGTQEFDELKRRNNWIDLVGCGLFLLVLISPLVVFREYLEPGNALGGWALGFGFGWAVILPIFWYTIATLPFGKLRFYEFWFYYQIKYEIGIKGILTVYIPSSILGIISAYKLITDLPV
jgi:hypothetical protein